MIVLKIISILLLQYLISVDCTIQLGTNGTLNDLLVYINDNVPPQDDAFINHLKSLLEKASEDLLVATNDLTNNGGVQLGRVYIRVPETWTITNASIPTWQQCNKADIFISTKSENMNSDKPYTKQINNCGDPGEFVRFSLDYIKNAPATTSTPGKVDKEIMREILKFRYGVYDETPYKNQIFEFYQTNFFSFACNKDVIIQSSKITECIQPNSICTYTVKLAQTHTHSVMSDTNTTSNIYVCNNSTREHNKHGPSIHNKMCNKTSIGEVMLRHSDYVANSRSNIQKMPLEFFVIKNIPRKIVMILDVSGSMSSIINKMIISATEFITDIIEDSASVAVVKFESTASIVKQLTSMTNEANRRDIANLLKKLTASGSTNIADGLVKGATALGGNIDNNQKVFGTFLLLTDGSHNFGSRNYAATIDSIIAKGIVVNTIAFGTNADSNMARLSSGSGGLAMFVPTSTPYTDLMDKFAERTTCENSLLKPVDIASGIINVDISVSQTIQLVYLDNYVGINTKFRITVQTTQSTTYTVVDPSGIEHSVTSTVTETVGVTITIKISGKAKQGKYNLKIKSSVSGRKKRAATQLTYSVQSSPDSSTSRIISPTGTISQTNFDTLTSSSKIKISVDTTTCGVTNNEYVSASVNMSSTGSSTYKMFYLADDGIGDDALAQDGIYTATIYYMDLAVVGYFKFDGIVKIVNSKTKDEVTRLINFPSVRVGALGPNATQDKVAPATIVDLQIFITNKDNKIVTLSWSAVGDNGMQGNISKYEIRITGVTNVTTNQLDFNVQPRSKINTQIKIDSIITSEYFEISIRGIDGVGNTGEWSNPTTNNWDIATILPKFTAGSNTVGNSGEWSNTTTSNWNITTVLPKFTGCSFAVGINIMLMGFFMFMTMLFRF